MGSLTARSAQDVLRDVLLPDWRAERDRLDVVDRWARWEHDDPQMPRTAKPELKQLAGLSKTSWLALVVTATAQQLYVSDYRSATAAESSPAWRHWQANGWDARQIRVHRGALTYGQHFALALPGDTGPVLRGISARRMLAWYEDPAADEWPALAAHIVPTRTSDGPVWRIDVYDDTTRWRFATPDQGGTLTLVGSKDHGAGVCPVVRYANSLDDDGRTDGEVEPHIGVASRIDTTVFDRVVTQRFASFKVRTATGMSEPETDEEKAAAALRLSQMEMLVAADADTRFGTLDGTPLDGFIAAAEADIRSLAAVTQTPPHYLLGSLVNLSAEALAAAEAALSRKVDERQKVFGESHAQLLRLAAHLDGDDVSAGDVAAQVRWADMESRSLSSVASALGVLASQVGVPVEQLWPMIPGWTEFDVAQARERSAVADPVQEAAAQLLRGAGDDVAGLLSA